MKKIIITAVFTGLLISIGVVFLVEKAGIRAYIITSGSMKPALLAGDLVLSFPSNEYHYGQVVVYEPRNEGIFVTHRIIGTDNIAGSRFYISKGDANDYADAEPISEKEIKGRVGLIIPYFSTLVSPAALTIFYGFAGFYIGSSVKRIVLSSKHE